MKCVCCRGGLAGLTTLVVLGLLLLVRWLDVPDAAEALGAQAAQPRQAGQPIAMPTNLAGLEIELGRKDKEPTKWDGEIQLSEGKVLETSIGRGGALARTDGNRFFARSFRQQPKKSNEVVGAIVRVSLDAPPT